MTVNNDNIVRLSNDFLAGATCQVGIAASETFVLVDGDSRTGQTQT